MIQINKNPSKKELVWFGLLCLGFFGLVGLSVLHKTHSLRPAMIVWIVAAVAIAIYFAIPPVRKPLYLGWMYAAYPIGWLMSYAVLAITFFLAFAPIGFLMRLMGRDPLARAIDPSASTYWTTHNPGTDPNRYFRQF